MQHISESIVSAVSLNESSIRFVMPVTGRGRVHALLVKQTAGSLDGFAVKLFSQSAACPPNYPEREEESETSDLSPDIFQVLETLTVAGAASFGAIRDSQGTPYTNYDNVTRERVEELYCDIIPNSPAANKSWDVRIVYQECD
jgi:hypothetical protein